MGSIGSTRDAVERLERDVGLLRSQITALVDRLQEQDPAEDASHFALSAPKLSEPSISQTAEIASLGDGQPALAEPIPITIEVLGDKVLVSDEQVNMYGSGMTLDEALTDYGASLLEYAEWLRSNEATLAAHLFEHLQWLRARVRVEESA